MKLENRYFFEIEKETSKYYKMNNINPDLRNKNEEYNYILQILVKYDLAKFIDNEKALENLKYCIDRYGFIEVQQILRELKYLKGQDRYYFGIHLRRKLEELDEEQRRKYIPAAIDAEAEKLNEKLNEELLKFEISKLEKTQGVTHFVNFAGRDRSENNKEGNMSFEDIERKLLGWDTDQ